MAKDSNDCCWLIITLPFLVRYKSTKFPKLITIITLEILIRNSFIYPNFIVWLYFTWDLSLRHHTKMVNLYYYYIKFTITVRTLNILRFFSVSHAKCRRLLNMTARWNLLLFDEITLDHCNGNKVIIIGLLKSVDTDSIYSDFKLILCLRGAFRFICP